MGHLIERDEWQYKVNNGYAIEIDKQELEASQKRIAELEALEQHRKRLLEWGKAWSNKIHPDYGICDAIADGCCTECLHIFEGLKAERDQLAAEVADLNLCLQEMTEDLDAYANKEEALIKERDQLAARLETARKDVEHWRKVAESLSESHFMWYGSIVKLIRREFGLK